MIQIPQSNDRQDTQKNNWTELQMTLDVIWRVKDLAKARNATFVFEDWHGNTLLPELDAANQTEDEADNNANQDDYEKHYK